MRHPLTSRTARPPGERQHGFSLIEILIATAVVAIALGGIAAGLQYGMSGIHVARQVATATFLAEQRMEQVKATALVNFAGATSAAFPPEPYGSIPTAPNYSRTVVITDDPGGTANTKLVQVNVFFRPLSAGIGVASPDRQVVVETLLANRS